MLVLGHLTVIGPDGSFDERDLPGVQGRLALAVLVCERRPISRDRLADIIWGDDQPSEWSGALSAVVSKIRQCLVRCGLGRDLVSSSAGSIELSLPAGSWVDLEDAIARLDRALGAQGPGRVDDALADATAASAILRRPLLPGVDNSWVDDLRREVDARHLRCLELLAELWLERGDGLLARTIADRAVALDPCSEAAYRLSIRSSLALGEAAQAERTFERCRATLRDDYGVEPSPETISVIAGRRGR